jgi:hypothetical protein
MPMPGGDFHPLTCATDQAIPADTEKLAQPGFATRQLLCAVKSEQIDK